VNLEAGRVADLAGRPLSKLTRRDVALALLTVPAADALGSLPGLRRGMLAAGNPLSAGFWASAEATLTQIADGTATVGDVRTWLEATGTEPKGIIGLHVWDEQSDRSQLAAEMHTRLVSHLEEQLAAGEIDPDLLAAADPEACQAYIEVQERWMTSPLSDGRVPMDVLLDEKDEEYLAEWDAADAEALAATQALLGRVGDRPLPQADLRRAAGRLRRDLARAGWPGRLLTDCSGLRPKSLPSDDTELWLSLAAGVASPQGPDDWDQPGPAGPDGDDPDDTDDSDSEIAAICAIDHFDWLAVITALAQGGPGTPASAADLAGYVRDYDPEDLDGPDDGPDDGPPGAADGETPDDEDDFGDAYFDDDDDLTLEGLFLPVTSLWQVLGAIDDDERLTSLGWWGLPEAMLRVWAPASGPAS
jgi:hypothetical protein